MPGEPLNSSLLNFSKWGFSWLKAEQDFGFVLWIAILCWFCTRCSNLNLNHTMHTIRAVLHLRKKNSLPQNLIFPRMFSLHKCWAVYFMLPVKHNICEFFFFFLGLTESMKCWWMDNVLSLLTGFFTNKNDYSRTTGTWSLDTTFRKTILIHIWALIRWLGMTIINNNV